MPTPSPENAPQLQSQAEDCLKIAEKVRTGEYFREARAMYDLYVHDPMAERYMYIFITCVSLVVLFIAMQAAQLLYPLNTEIPLIFNTNNVVEDVPHIQTLLQSKQDDPGEALLRFMVKHYVLVREEYDIDTFDRDINSVKSQSSEAVLQEYLKRIDPRNPDSPISQYQRHAKRKIGILSAKRTGEGMEVVFEAIVQDKDEVKKSRWVANIAFQYTGVALDDTTDTVKPVKFVVTEYYSKRLQDIK